MFRVVFILQLFFSLAVLGGNATVSPERQIFDLLNHDRENAGLERLQWSDRLAEAARAHTTRMVDWKTIGHQFPGEPSSAERMGLTGARFTLSGENVAKGYTAEEAHAALMASPGHRENIMSTQYNSIGIGVVENDGRLYVTEDFATIIQDYTEQQFADAVAAALARSTNIGSLRAIDVHVDSQLHRLACDQHVHTVKTSYVPAAANELVIFTLSDPDKLPQDVLSRIVEKRPHRMSIGVCFKPDSHYGYANFWVVLAFNH